MGEAVVFYELVNHGRLVTEDTPGKERLRGADSMQSEQERLQQQTRLASFGQDASRLHEREDGKKPWRAEFPALEDDKAAARGAAAAFLERWPLDVLKLDNVYHHHKEYLRARIAEAGPGHKPWLADRLGRLEAAHTRLGEFELIFNLEKALGDVSDFISTVHGEPHGARTRMRAQPRQQAYAKGKLTGASPTRLHPACTLRARTLPAC